MDKAQILQTITNILNDMGMAISDKEVKLTEYITSSIEFITFIVSVEEAFKITFPDQWLQYETIEDMNLLCDIIAEAQIEGNH